MENCSMSHAYVIDSPPGIAHVFKKIDNLSKKSQWNSAPFFPFYLAEIKSYLRSTQTQWQTGNFKKQKTILILMEEMNWIFKFSIFLSQ